MFHHLVRVVAVITPYDHITAKEIKTVLQYQLLPMVQTLSPQDVPIYTYYDNNAPMQNKNNI